MTTFEFVSVLLSIVVSLAFAHLLTGVARLIQARIAKVSWLYFGWMGLILFSCVDYWFSLWQARLADVWSLVYVVFWLLLATALYLTSWLAVPSERTTSESVDLAAFYNSNRRNFLGAFFAYIAIGLFGNLTVATLQSAALVSLVFMGLIGAAWLWRDSRIQIAALAASYLLIGWYMVTYIPAL
jgi:hypothetical protein